MILKRTPGLRTYPSFDSLLQYDIAVQLLKQQPKYGKYCTQAGPSGRAF